eukprot:29642-Pelagococcus_subviridis.AAC.8
MRKAIINANKAIASVNANPRIAYPNKVLVSAGLRATELIKEPKTIPIPAPAPANAMVAHPAPMSFAPSAIYKRHVSPRPRKVSRKNKSAH